MDEYFDAENLCYWMAFNILTGNYDVGARNLFLYSPLNSRRFYVICWDMDASFRHSYFEMRNYSEGGSWEQGMTLFLGLTLINRMMKEAEYRDMLANAVEDIYKNYVNFETVGALVTQYSKVTKPFLYEGSDSRNAILTEEKYDSLIPTIRMEPVTQRRIFIESLQRPWPFFVDLPQIDEENQQMEFSWGIAYDTRGEPVTYDFALARDYSFTDVIAHEERMTVPYFNWDILPPGKYFLKVTATNRSGYTTDCFDYFVASGKHYGCYGFTIQEDGTVAYYGREG